MNPTQVRLVRMADSAAGPPGDVPSANGHEAACECAIGSRYESMKGRETARVCKCFEKIPRCKSGCVKGCEAARICVMSADVPEHEEWV